MATDGNAFVCNFRQNPLLRQGRLIRIGKKVGCGVAIACQPPIRRRLSGRNGGKSTWRFALLHCREFIHGYQARWYGCPAMIVVARYSCSASTSRTSMCGRVSGPSDQR